ncbi:MAG TPA: M1 family aminopeptidase, partial [Pyrinomonadaceae bacterium]|nr:M1 family aminopeptidase [Pyrinomonadaceae bacterium]
MIAFSQMPPVESGVSHDLAIWRASHYSDVRYKLNLTLEKMSPVLKGTIEIRVSLPLFSCEECPPQFIVLDWRKIQGHEKDSTISNVTLNGIVAQSAEPGTSPKKLTVNYEERNDHLIFSQGINPGENVIKLDFTSPILTSGSAITRYVDKEDGAEYIYSLFVPSDASTAFPVFDQPDLKARFTLSIIHPDGWKTISNTQLGRHVEWSGAGAMLIYEETKPISTYVFAFAAGLWERVSVPPAVAGGLTPSTTNSTGPIAALLNRALSTDDVQPPATSGGTDKTAAGDLATSVYVRKSQAAKFKPHAAEVFRLTREGIKYLETYFDYKFPWPKYDLVLIPEFPFGGMEHAGATFLRESSVIFPTEPTKNDQISRANLIFHETAHQWFGDTVTMKWFDDLWLKEGFAEFMAYKTLEKVMPEANAWKVFYERNKQAAYATDSTKGTTPIYQEIKNLSAAKSAYGNIVYRKAPSFLRQAEFYLGEDKFQTAVRAFLKKHEYANAEWRDLVTEFEAASQRELGDWSEQWVTQRGMPIFRASRKEVDNRFEITIRPSDILTSGGVWKTKT